MLNNISSITIPIVGLAGFLDGIHPCAIAILLFFIAFLLTLQRKFKNIFFLGLVYILVIFLTYLTVGLGIFSGIMLFGRHHFLAEVGAWLLIAIGLFQIKGFIYPKSLIGFRAPKIGGKNLKTFLEKATLPGVIIGAFFVGLCSIPCSGGIYAAVIALLASRATFFTGFLYLLLYNFMFVLPLLILLVLAINPVTLAKIAEFRQRNERITKLVIGALMIIVGGIILIFFV